MEHYHYVNIFETKGLEYLLVIAFLLGLIMLVKQLRTARQVPRQVPAEGVHDERRPTGICTAEFHCPYRIDRTEGDGEEHTPDPLPE